jgi:hypothetical protein
MAKTVKFTMSRGLVITTPGLSLICKKEFEKGPLASKMSPSFHNAVNVRLGDKDNESYGREMPGIITESGERVLRVNRGNLMVIISSGSKIHCIKNLIFIFCGTISSLELKVMIGDKNAFDKAKSLRNKQKLNDGISSSIWPNIVQ